MLQEIYIHNFVLIDEIRLHFTQGMNVLSGETGAGKSMIVDALSLLMGQRAIGEYLRDQSQKAVIEAVFDLEENSTARNFLAEQGLALEEDNILVVTRELMPGGKTIARVNNRTATVSLLRQLSEKLIDMNGQHDRLDMIQPNMYLYYLDSFIDESAVLHQELQECFRQWQQIKQELDIIKENKQEREQRMDYLAYQIKEIEQAQLIDGEEEKGEELRDRIKNAQQLVEGSSRMIELLYHRQEGAAVFDHLYAAMSIAEELCNDPFFAQLVEPLENMYYQIEDIAEQLTQYRDTLDFEPGLLEQTEQRLYEISQLKNKYGDSIAEVLQYLEQARHEHDVLNHSDERQQELIEKEQQYQEKYRVLSADLHRRRIEAAAIFETRVKQELLDLNMPHIRFQVQIEAKEPSADGIDQVDLLFSPNPGEKMQPLARIASGGELSRFILAVKKALAEVYQVPTLVFDEIDVGLGGAALTAMANKIAELSRTHQTVVITHSPQLSSYADRHFQVEKYVLEGQTYTRVKVLDEEERIEELARMLDGENFSDLTLQHAREMLDKNRQAINSQDRS